MKIRYGVHCIKHGVESKNWAGKQVIVPVPKNRQHQKTAGCPVCKAEAVTL